MDISTMKCFTLEAEDKLVLCAVLINLGKIHPPFFIDATNLFLGVFPLITKGM